MRTVPYAHDRATSLARVAIWLLVPTPNPVVNRRQMMLGAAAIALLSATAAACGEPPPPPDLDDLVAQLDRARTDSKLAGDAAAAVPKNRAAALTTVASERAAHAQALSDEIARMGEPVPTSATSSSSATATATSTPAPAPTAADVVAALKGSAESAAGVAAQLSGYRAGLLGSIAAACTAAYTVALATPGATA
jgi:hypothetical protein